MIINIREKIGTRCILKDDGQRLFNEIEPSLRDDMDVTLNFDGVSLFASPFFNFSVGQLITSIPENTVKNKLHIQNLDTVGESVMSRVIENASKFHADRDYKKIVDNILELHAKETD
ncbi:STAS-like domain-containing protein [Pantoea agglomerans]|uniref:STAS-like domain-containing protein n=1 Tax=Enterobacter agglomerans TaxID=549 RepID=UPI003BF47E85